MELRAGKVLAAERVPKKDKLLKLSIDLGEATPRTIVSGVAQSYAPERAGGKGGVRRRQPAARDFARGSSRTAWCCTPAEATGSTRRSSASGRQAGLHGEVMGLFSSLFGKREPEPAQPAEDPAEAIDSPDGAERVRRAARAGGALAFGRRTGGGAGRPAASRSARGSRGPGPGRCPFGRPVAAQARGLAEVRERGARAPRDPRRGSYGGPSGRRCASPATRPAPRSAPPSAHRGIDALSPPPARSPKRATPRRSRSCWRRCANDHRRQERSRR